ncbi:inner membrane protein [Klebsiella pneumoniae]|uniref:Inner membrane protein n=1 Tax=Klebsiella pneumoniae TaxID=573 RepID=A0A377XPR1_KLEPN|nr:inner membrane protein [Klebsiella pneumoniae]
MHGEKCHAGLWSRGVAILGILLLNISAFGLPKAAYLNPAWSGSASLSDAWTWALLDLLAQVKFLTLFALLFGAGLQLLLPRGKRWIQSRLTLLALLGFIHGLFFWDGDILLAYALVGLVSWRMVREAHHVKSLFNTGVVLYLTGIAVLVLLGMISGTAANRSWAPDAANLQYEQYWKLHGGMEAVSNRADMLSDNLLALGAQYGWQLAGMMLMGAALMRSGWLKGQFSLRHYRRTGALLVAAGMAVNLPAIFAQWYLAWDYRWCAFLLQAPRELSAPLQAIGYAALAWGYWPQLCRFRLVGAIACVGRMALTNYLLQTLICTTLFYHLGLFMRFDRLQLLAFVPPIWAVNLLVSSLWLRRSRQGPVEWLWRQLTLRASGTSLKDTSR